MSDMSRTIRHPDVVAGRMESIADSIAWHREQIAEREDELRQMIEISHQMMLSSDKRL